MIKITKLRWGGTGGKLDKFEEKELALLLRDFLSKTKYKGWNSGIDSFVEFI